MKRFLACLMVVCMLVTLMPVTLAEEASYPEITTEEELRAAALEGGTYFVTGAVSLYNGPLEVNKDLTLYLNESIQKDNADPATYEEPVFIVEGATLTVATGTNGTAHGVFYYGSGSIARLIGAETQTALISDGCNMNAYNLYGETTVSADSLFYVECADGMPTPRITLDGGSYYAMDEQGGDQGPLVSGATADLTIKGGYYRYDVSEYLEEGYVCLSQYGERMVLKVDTEFSDAFTLTDDGGVLAIKRYEPVTEMDLANMIDMMMTTYGYPDPAGPQQYTFFSDSYDFENHTLYAGRTDENGKVQELHEITLNFVYDADIKAQVDAIVETLPEGTYNEEYDYMEPYFFQVTDLELFNYWMTCNESNDWFNVNNLINYSTEFKERIDYKNFRLDARAGDGDFFFTMAYGIADFSYGDTVYASGEIGVNADHILYVSGGLTAEAEILAAAQTRLDRYFGAGVVVVEQLTDEEKSEMGVSDPVDHAVFKTTINDMTYYVKAVPDSTKWLVPSYRNVDILSEVEVRSESTAEFPLDSMVAVEKLTEGEEYERITGILNPDVHETYDINLFSSSINDFVTKLERGNFEVQIPISEQLEGKDLAAYYVDANGKVEEYEVTIKDGKASFYTDHFSAYTLSTPVELPGLDVPDYGDPEVETHDYIWNEETQSYVCECGTAYVQTLDLDGDGSATTADAIQLLRTIDKVGDLPAYAADINSDGKIKVYDAVRYLQLLNA